jgi:hypothetical protein
MLAGCAGSAPRQQTVPSSGSSSSSWAELLRAAAGPGPGLAAHDPATGNLFDQIPAWDRAAEKRCCSVLSRTEFIQSRCDTDQPLNGRTNRC